MLDLKYIRENKGEVQLNCKNRAVDADIDKLISLDDKRRELIAEIDDLRAERNKGSKGKPSPADIAKMKEVGENIKEKETKLEKIEKELSELLFQVPNKT
ncbi:MAG TPA: serine--tRNA ligase, partial [Bacteroidetes bacterium]|nr:serine--tRNA ligase [Bacteroidota bacterium]